MSKNNIYGTDLLPKDITLTKLKSYIQDTDTQYNRSMRRMRILDGAAKGRLWEVVKAKFPAYQIMPDTNHTHFLASNLVASIYATGQIPELLPKSPEDTQFVNEFNSALATIWDQVKAEEYQQDAGINAALFNLGITQVGWRKDILSGTAGHWYKGDLVFKDISPMQFRRDPYAKDLDNSRFCYYTDSYSETYISSMDIYKARVEEIKKAQNGSLDGITDAIPSVIEPISEKATSDKQSKGYHTITSMWVMLPANNDDGFRICEIHLLDNEYVLYVKDSIKPNMYPFALLYCNHPRGDLIGYSEPALQFPNSLAYNLLNSIQATYAYKANRPAKFVNTAAGINLREFAKHGNDADKTFPVTGDASTAVHYAQLPPLPPELSMVKQSLDFDIQKISGIDGRYTGRDTGSIQGTGGVDSMLTRATGIDEIKISNIGKYTKTLGMLVVNNYTHYAEKRKYMVKDPIYQEFKEVEIDFFNLSEDTRFGSVLEAHTLLPRNKSRIAATATMLLEKQMQYQPKTELITVEEWLMMQDIPFKDLIFKRMGLQRNIVMTEQVAQTLAHFADLVENGVDPAEAMDEVANTLQQQQIPGKLGNVGNSMNLGAPQLAQQGAPEMEQETPGGFEEFNPGMM